MKHVTGHEQIIKTLNALDAEMRNRLNESAVSKVGKALLGAMLFNVPVRFGSLKQSLATKAIGYPANGKAVSITGGTRRQVYKTPEGISVPSKYLHLIEFGHIAGAPWGKGKKAERKKAAASFTGPKFGYVGFVPPQPFIRPALDLVAPMAGDIMGTEFSAGITRLVRRYQRGQARSFRATMPSFAAEGI